MTAIMSRDETGVVQAGDVQFRIQKDKSIFTVCTSMPIYDGDDLGVSEKHWITNGKGQKRRKLFVNGQAYDDSPIQVWSLKMEPDHLEVLELKYHYMEHVFRPAVMRQWNDAIDRLKEVGGKAHAIPDNSQQNNGDIRFYDTHYSEYVGCDTLGYDWVPRPAELLHPDVGQALYHVDKRTNQLFSRISKFRSVFLRHLEKRINDAYKQNGYKLKGPVFVFKINGREYFVLVHHYRTTHCSYELIDPVRL